MREADLDLLVELRLVPKTHAAYRTKTIDELRSCIDSFLTFHMKPTESHGFSFTAEAIAEFTEGLEELVEVLVEGVTRYDDRRQRARVNELTSESAKKDATLCRLLDTGMRP